MEERAILSFQLLICTLLTLKSTICELQIKDILLTEKKIWFVRLRSWHNNCAPKNRHKNVTKLSLFEETRSTK